MRFHPLGVVLFGAVVAVTHPSTARADDASDARALFEHGRDLRAHGNCADALSFFQKAYAVYPPGLGSLRNVAVCQEALSRFASARDSWVELRRAVTVNADAKYAGWTDDADRAIARLAPKVARVTVDLSVLSPGGEPMVGDGVDITIDGKPMPRDQVGAAVDHDPGIHVVRAAGPDVMAPDQQTVELSAGDNKHVALRVTVRRAPASPEPLATESATGDAPSGGEEHRSSPLRTGAWIALGVGAVGIAGAVVSLIVRQSALGDLKNLCPSYSDAPCPSASGADAMSDVSRGKTASTLLTVFGVAGGVGVVAGVTLWSVSRARQAQTAVVLTPTGLSASGAF